MRHASQYARVSENRRRRTATRETAAQMLSQLARRVATQLAGLGEEHCLECVGTIHTSYPSASRSAA